MDPALKRMFIKQLRSVKKTGLSPHHGSKRRFSQWNSVSKKSILRVVETSGVEE